jgi:hypothetical protein
MKLAILAFVSLLSSFTFGCASPGSQAAVRSPPRYETSVLVAGSHARPDSTTLASTRATYSATL